MLNRSYSIEILKAYSASDITPSKMSTLLGKLGKAAAAYVGARSLVTAKEFVMRTLRSVDVQIMASLRESGLHDMRITGNKSIDKTLSAAIKANVSLIKSIPQQYHTQLETVIMQALALGKGSDYVADILVDRYGITKRRANNIARDQNGRITNLLDVERSLALGIKSGRWVHTHEGITQRASHELANGKLFNLREGCLIDGERILPGEKINCRCRFNKVLRI